MKGMKQIMVAGVFILVSTISVADIPSTDVKTPLDANWGCTTNASTSTNDAENAADDKMANSATSLADAFAFATAHCRDCTQVTCEVKSQ